MVLSLNSQHREDKACAIRHSIVREYANLFFDDLAGHSVEREVEFTIELMLGTAPISKAPH